MMINGTQTYQTDYQVPISEAPGRVSALLMRPENARMLLVLGHGAGAGILHPFMVEICEALANIEIATFRYQFPYMEQGRRRPNPRPVLAETSLAAVETAAKEVPDLPLFAGGKSMGGRMTSLAAANEPLPHVKGIVFFGFPLHPAGKLGTNRADHLTEITVPMLFLQGTRDSLANLSYLEPVCDQLGWKAKLHVIDTADHSFQVLKRTGKTQDEVMRELATTVAYWAAPLI